MAERPTWSEVSRSRQCSEVPAWYLYDVARQNRNWRSGAVSAQLALARMLYQHSRLIGPIRRAASSSDRAHHIEAAGVGVGTWLFHLAQDVKRAKLGYR